MPELPEVETITRELRQRGLIGRRIRGVRINCTSLIAPLAPQNFARHLKGRIITALRRRAKFIVMELAPQNFALIHLRMSGHLELCAPQTPHKPHEHIILDLDNGYELRYRDPRRFGRWLIAKKPELVLGRLGPEPLSKAFTPHGLLRRLSACRRQLKPLLLDQTFLAGIGNIYADESLWEAQLHPQRSSATVSAAEAQRLFRAIRLTLRRGIKNGGTSLGDGAANYRRVAGQPGKNQNTLRVFRRTGRPCPRCGQPIKRMQVAQRSTHICSICQPP